MVSGECGHDTIDAMDLVRNVRLDRSVFDIVSLDEEGDDREYWRARSPEERMQALELMRQIIYGYDPATARLQRFFEVAELE
jgi:hypothetical protein